MFGYSTLVSFVLAATALSGVNADRPPQPTSDVPIGRRDPKGLDALAQRRDNRYFGVAWDVGYISDTNYTQLVLAQFGQFTAENSLKWETTEPQQGVFNFTKGDIVVKTAQKNRMSFRAHVLVWHSQLPAWVTAGNFTKEALTNVIKDHIKGVAGHYKGDVYTWDVVNEVFNEDGTWRSTVFYNTIGAEFIDIAFKAAKKADPHAMLAINDYNIDGAGPKSTAMINLVKSSRRRGIPIEQIGAQAHLVVGTLPTTIKENWQAFADTGARVAITEIDIRMPVPATPESLAQQAADYKYVIESCLAVRGCVGMTVWGASDKYSWVPGVFEGEGAPLPWDENFAPKPAYTAIVQALKKH